METQAKRVNESEFQIHHAQIGVVCPLCRRRHFLEVADDYSMLNSPAAKEIHAHLEAWMASRCPDHLGFIAQMSRN
ncbi:MAG: hypothetical protein ABSB82_02685 [Terriglobia bacterium]